MELDEAKSLLSTLANGINPFTGEVLPDTSPYNEPRVIRALFAVLDSVKGSKQRKKTPEEKQQENISSGRPRNAGLPWTDSLKEELARRFKGGASLDELAKDFERTKGSIVSELVKQGIVEQGDASGMR